MAKDIQEYIVNNNQHLNCALCGAKKISKDFFVSYSYNSLGRRGTSGNQTRMVVCKDCAKMVYGYLNKIFQDAKKALYLYCVSFDVYYDEELYEQLKSVDDEDKLSTYMSFIENGAKYKNRSFVDSLNEEERKVESSLPQDIEEKEVELGEEDLKNRKEIMSIYHYDPFENETTTAKKRLYSDLCTMCDDSLRDDLVRQRAALEIVRSFSRIDKWTVTIDEWTKDPKSLLAKSKELKALIDTKAKETDMITKFSKDHGFAERWATAKSRGTGTLSAVMRDMEEFNYDDGKVNFYDIKTSESMQQASDISMKSIMKQLNLQEADYVQMLKEQRERMVGLESELDRTKEELRLVHKMIKKQDLLKELATALITSGMTKDETAQAILSEIHYDDELIKKAKKEAGV